MTRPPVRLLTTGALTVVTLGLVAGPAAAHVTVPDPATHGGFGAITFRVPTERPNASTNKLEVTFPADQPLAFVSVKPHPGWTYQVDKVKLAQPLDVEGRQVTEAVSKITWTAGAAPAAIHPGEYDEFSVSGGSPPKADQMVFKAVQTYDNGEIVRWIELAAPGAAEPEHPAPALKLVPQQEQQTVGLTTQRSTADAPSRSSVNLAIGLSIAALLVGLLAGAVGGGGVPAAHMTSMRRTAATPGSSGRWAPAAPWLATAARSALAGVWIAAGVLKIPDPAASVRAVRAYRLLPEAAAAPLGHGLPFLEVALGGLLLIGAMVRLAALISATLLILFIAAIISAWSRGLQWLRLPRWRRHCGDRAHPLPVGDHP